MRVPLLDLTRQYRAIRDEVASQIAEVFASQRFILAAKVKELEERLARYLNVPRSVGVSSGTDALLVALMALEVGPGSAVVTTPFTFFATAGVVARLKARPVFVDIDPVSYNLSPVRLAEFFENNVAKEGGQPRLRGTGERVAAVIPVHLFGQVCDMARVLEKTGEYGVPVVEDAAQALAADHMGNMAGSMGDAGCFSFFPTKNLGGAGDGGLVAAGDVLAEKVGRLRVHGAHPKYYHDLVGGNFRLDELQAAVLLAKLSHLEDWTKKRISNASLYKEMLSNRAPVKEGRVVLPEVVGEGKTPHVFNQYVIRAEDRDSLKRYLEERGIGTEIYYPVPLHLQKCFSYLGLGPGDLPEAEAAAKEVLALPIFPELEPSEIEYVAQTLASFYKT